MIQDLSYFYLDQDDLNNNRKITEKQLDNAFENILTNQQDYFLQLYEDLSSYQKKVLLALAISREHISLGCWVLGTGYWELVTL